MLYTENDVWNLPAWRYFYYLVASLAGAINTVAGGGSNLVLPTLMIMGMPPEVANATNRVGIFVESVVAVSEFKRHDRLETFDLRAILVPMAIGGSLVLSPPLLLPRDLKRC